MAVHRQRSQLRQCRQVHEGTVTLVALKAITWIDRAQFFHQAIAGDLGDNRRRRDRWMQPIAFDDRRLRQLQSRNPPLAINQYTPGRNPTLSCSAASVWPNISNCKLCSLNSAKRHDILLPRKGRRHTTRPKADEPNTSKFDS